MTSNYKTKEKVFKSFTKGKIYQINQRFFRCKFRVVSAILGPFSERVNIEVIEGEYLSARQTWCKVNTLDKSMIIQANKRIRRSYKGNGNMDCINNGFNLITLSDMIGITGYEPSRLFSIDRIIWKKNK
jgi:hypothetical protein